MQISATGRAIVKAFESCMQAIRNRPGFFKAYRDIVGVLTIGWGHTNVLVPHFDENTEWSQEQCDAALVTDMADSEAHVTHLAKVPLTQNEFDALASWTFNCGGPATATLWKVLNAGNKAGVPAELLKWDKAGGVTIAGLTRRRRSEAQLFAGNISMALGIAQVTHVVPDVSPAPIVTPVDPLAPSSKAAPIPAPVDTPLTPVSPWATLFKALFKR